MAVFKQNTIKEVSYKLINPINKVMKGLLKNLQMMKGAKSIFDIPNYWKFDSWLVDPVNSDFDVSYSGGIVNIDLDMPFDFTQAILYNNGQKVAEINNDRLLPTHDSDSPQLTGTHWEIDFKYFEDGVDLVVEFKNAKIANSMILKAYNNNLRNTTNKLLRYADHVDTWDFFANQVKTAIFLKDKLHIKENIQLFTNILLGVPGFPMTGVVDTFTPLSDTLYVRIKKDDKYYDFKFPRFIMLDTTTLDLNSFIDSSIEGRELKIIGETLIDLTLLG